MKPFLAIYRTLIGITLRCQFLLPSKTSLRLWLQSRHQKEPILPKDLGPFLLFHCSSVGEYQGLLSLMAECHQAFPSYKIVLTVFSPQAFEKIEQTHDELIDLVLSSPIDSQNNINRFFLHSWPKNTFISGLEIWPEFIHFHIRNNINYHFCNVTVNPNSHIKRAYLTLLKPFLNSAQKLWCSTAEDTKFLHSLGLNNVETSGDLRIELQLKDVKLTASSEKHLPKTDQFKILMGSFEPHDLAVYEEFKKAQPEALMIIVPHTLSLLNSSKYQLLKKDSNTLIINRYGILKSLYQEVDLAYIGGGFDGGVHNVFEAFLYERPCIIGPKYKKYSTLRELVAQGLISPIDHPSEVNRALEKLNLLAKDSSREQIDEVMQKHRNASAPIIKNVVDHERCN